MKLFHASTQKYESGHPIPPTIEPTPGHRSRIKEGDAWNKMEEAFEARRAGGNSRGTSYYACATPAECALYSEAQQRDPITKEQLDHRQLHYYEVAMENPTRCVMALCNRGMRHVDVPDVMDEIAAEYWRQEKHQWEFFEYLDSTMRIVAEVDSPNDDEINVARTKYQNDTEKSLQIWR